MTKKAVWFLALGIFLIIASPFIFIFVISAPSSIVDWAEYRINTWKAAENPDKTISIISCPETEYQWKIIETEKVWRANRFEGGEGKIEKYRKLQLVRGDVVIGQTNEDNFDLNTASFPAGEPFVKAYALNKSLDPETPKDIRINLVFPSSRISVDDFNKSAECLRVHASAIETALNEHSYTGLAEELKPLGWVMLINNENGSDLKKGEEFSLTNAKKEFSCTDETQATIYGDTARFFNENHTPKAIEFLITPQGTLVDRWTRNVTPPPTDQCSDNNGNSLSDFLQTIPQRIDF